MRPSSIPLLLTLAWPASGCCSFARFFCGPDKSPWVSVDYATPEAAVRTLLEALRRDEPEIVYRSLSPACRQRLGLTQSTLLVGWPQFRAQNPGLHVAGYAEVPQAQRLGPDAARLELSIEGRTLVVDLVRTLQWTVQYRLPAIDSNDPQRFDPHRFGSLFSPGQYVVSPADLVAVEPDAMAQKSTLRLRPLVFLHDGLDEVPVDAIETAGLHREWKIDRLAAPDAP